MARYDRIARISPPPRDGAFAGWFALRDLEGRERDPDLGRRARVRFLAVRAVHRLREQGDATDRESLRQQCETVREELGQLPSRDPERLLLAELLKRIATAEPGPIARTALDLADAARTQGHPHAAEEWQRAGSDLAARYGLEGFA